MKQKRCCCDLKIPFYPFFFKKKEQKPKIPQLGRWTKAKRQSERSHLEITNTYNLGPSSAGLISLDKEGFSIFSASKSLFWSGRLFKDVALAGDGTALVHMWVLWPPLGLTQLRRCLLGSTMWCDERAWEKDGSC